MVESVDHDLGIECKKVYRLREVGHGLHQTEDVPYLFAGKAVNVVDDHEDASPLLS